MIPIYLLSPGLHSTNLCLVLQNPHTWLFPKDTKVIVKINFSVSLSKLVEWLYWNQEMKYPNLLFYNSVNYLEGFFSYFLYSLIPEFHWFCLLSISSTFLYPHKHHFSNCLLIGLATFILFQPSTFHSRESDFQSTNLSVSLLCY